MSRIEQVIKTLEAERADVQQRLAWLEKQIKEFRSHHLARDGQQPPAAKRPRRTGRRASAAAATTTRATRGARTATPAGAGDVRSQIIAYLQQHPNSTAGDIASGTGLRRNTVSTRLTQLSKAGEIKKQARGYAAK